jgi:prevent-host-death family protein
MKTATIIEVRNGLSALLDQVRHGETILITDRGVPIARIEGVVRDGDPSGRLDRLERAGLIRRGRGELSLELLRQHGPALSPGSSVVEAVIEERRTGR